MSGANGPSGRERETTMSEADVTVTVVDHPLVAERLRTLRDVGTTNATFRRALAELGTMLVYEATRSLATVDAPVTTPLTEAPARLLVSQPVVVPVLRAGLGLLESAMNLLPDADVGFIGMAHDETTFAPTPYVSKLPGELDDRPVIVLDPMLATGGSLRHACELLVAARRPGAADGRVRARRPGRHRAPARRRARPAHLHRQRRQPPQREGLHRAWPRRRRRPPVRPA